MSEYRSATLPISFGINVDPQVARLQLAYDLVQVADNNGVDFVGIQDHPYLGMFFDTWTLLTHLASKSNNVRFFTNVANLPLRSPAVFAKSAATLDVLTQGRVEIGLGAGAFWPKIVAYGEEQREPKVAIDSLKEATQVMRLIWGQSENAAETASFAGTHYTLNEAEVGPHPAHPINIWYGVYKPRALRLAGRLSDGISVSQGYMPPEQVVAAQRLVDEGAQAAGRDINAIRRVYNVMGEVLPQGQASRTQASTQTIGPVDEWVERIVEYYTELGMDTFIFWPFNGNELAQAELFIHEVMPKVKEKLAAR
jgi:alkanesulfonate monooxygenase SsuD/methylene tetrahydromethanopterin reductase-like flavin-dependent oxidoreductase (luciferase family)